jgi:hypothetical protein
MPFTIVIYAFINLLIYYILISTALCTTDCNSPDTLSLSQLFLNSDLLDTLTYTHILYHTHSSRLPRLSSPGLGSLLNQPSGCV